MITCARQRMERMKENLFELKISQHGRYRAIKSSRISWNMTKKKRVVKREYIREPMEEVAETFQSLAKWNRKHAVEYGQKPLREGWIDD